LGEAEELQLIYQKEEEVYEILHLLTQHLYLLIPAYYKRDLPVI